MTGSLSADEITNVLSSQVLGRLACCENGVPYIVPVTYTYDGNYIYGQSLVGKKLEILRRNPHICFEVDMMTDMQNWKSVLVDGIFEELEGKAAEQARSILFGRVLSLMTSSTVHPHEHNAEDVESEFARIKPVMYRIKINETSGRFERN